VGAGVASFSHIGGTHFQNLHEFEPYLASLDQGRLPIYRALTPNPEERMIREFILQMKLGHVRGDYFAGKFGIDVTRRFAAPLADLRERGLASAENGSLRLTRQGLLQVEKLLHEFFLPQHRIPQHA
jgi:oxygen-independent coproporphyrinogen-3 oxidase